MEYTETVAAQLGADGFVELSLDRTYKHGAKYIPTLYFQSDDVPQLADAIERFARTNVVETVKLADGTVTLFTMDPNPAIHLELKRPGFALHGGHDSLDMAPRTVSSLVAALRAAAES